MPAPAQWGLGSGPVLQKFRLHAGGPGVAFGPPAQFSQWTVIVIVSDITGGSWGMWL